MITNHNVNWCEVCSCLERNLVFLGTLDELRFSYRAKNGFLHVLKNDNLILSGIKKHSLYVLNGYCHIPSACIVKSDRIDF